MQQTSLPGFESPPREIHNLFFALWPDEPTRAKIAEAAAWMQRTHHPRGRWIKPPRYHLTLQFLGEHPAIPQALIERACTAAVEVRADPFDLMLDIVGSFGNTKIPCWLGSSERPARLHALFDALSTALRANGCRVAQGASLVPHVTVLRDAESVLQARLDESVRWRVDEFVLIDSRTQPFQPYHVIGRWPLSRHSS